MGGSGREGDRRRRPRRVGPRQRSYCGDGLTAGVRADVFLVSHGYAATRAEAQLAIRAGNVTADGQKVTKPAQILHDRMRIAYMPAHPFVSRGGVKLSAALDWFELSPHGLVCLDLGASTGGFTQVLLNRGAARVYAVDVGHGQLRPELLNSGQVVALEGVNARDLSGSLVPEPVQALTADVSFISLRVALGPALRLATIGAWAAMLVKPQFEAGPDAVPPDGVIRDQAVREKALAQVTAWVAEQGWRILGAMESPITGKEGNIEYLLAATKTNSTRS